MNDSGDSDSDAKVTVYSVPRQYDLATLFVVSVAFALLFSVLRLLGASPVVFAVVTTFVALVGLGRHCYSGDGLHVERQSPWGWLMVQC